MHMEAYLGAPESYDLARIAGSPSLQLRIPGGVPGDIATASIVVNSISEGATFRFRCTVDDWAYQYVHLNDCSIVR